MNANEVAILITARDEATKVMKDVGDSAQGAASSMTKIGVAAAGISFVAVGAGLVSSFNAAADFEQQISAVAAVSQATKGELEALADAGKRIGRETSFSATEAAKAMEILAANGVSATDIINGAADASVALAAAGGTDLVTAADLASTAMTVWGLKTSDMTDVVNRMAGAANVSRFGVEDMALAVAQGGGAAASAGVEFGDFTTAIAAIAPSFSSGSDAGTSFKTFLARLIPEGDKASSMMTNLGLRTADGANAFFDAQGNMKSMAEVADLLHTATKDLTEQEKAQALQVIFGTDAMRAAAAMSKLTGEEFQKMDDTMRTSDAAAIASQRMDNARGAMESLKGSIEVIQIEIGSKLLPVFAAAALWLAEKLPAAFDAASSKISALMNWFESLAGEDSPITKAASALAQFLDPLQSDNSAEFGLLNALSKIVETLAGKVIPAFESVAPIIKQFSTDVLGALSTTLNNDITPKLQAMWPVVQKVAEVILTDVIPAVAEFAKQVGEFLFPKIKTLIEFISNHKELLVGFAIAMSTLLVPAVIAWTVATVANAAAHVALAAAVVVAYAPVIALIAVLTLLATGIILLIKNWDDITAAVGRFKDKIVDTTVELINKVMAGHEELKEFLLSHWELIVAGILAIVFPPGAGLFLLITHFDEVKGKLGEIAGAIKDALGEAFTNTKDAVVGIFGDLIGGALDKMHGLKNDLLNAAADIKYGLIEAFQQTKDWLGRVWDGVADVIKWPINQAIGFINQLIGAWNGLSFSAGGGSVLGVSIPKVEFGTPYIGYIPYLAKGGIVTRPTLAVIGEAGPEAVVPLSKGGAMGTTYNYTINVQALDGTSAAQIIMRELVKWERRGGIAPGTTRAVA